MDFKEIKRLIALVEEAKISAFKIDTGTVKIEIEKNGGQTFVTSAPAHFVAPPATALAPTTSDSPAPAKAETPGITVKSPMVGTFYSSPSPDAPAFVSVGDTVSKGQAVCIIEAMKLFNEIESEVSGVVEKILVNNGDPVEYGQDLFVLRAN